MKKPGVKNSIEEAAEALVADRLDREHVLIYCEDATGWGFCLTCGNTACIECRRRHASRHPWCEDCEII
jgi:hypothetical protein